MKEELRKRLKELRNQEVIDNDDREYLMEQFRVCEDDELSMEIMETLLGTSTNLQVA